MFLKHVLKEKNQNFLFIENTKTIVRNQFPLFQFLLFTMTNWFYWFRIKSGSIPGTIVER